MPVPEELTKVLDAAWQARMELWEHVMPRDDTERAIVNALGEISWDEAVNAINKYRREKNANA